MNQPRTLYFSYDRAASSQHTVSRAPACPRPAPSLHPCLRPAVLPCLLPAPTALRCPAHRGYIQLYKDGSSQIPRFGEPADRPSVVDPDVRLATLTRGEAVNLLHSLSTLIGVSQDRGEGVSRLE